MQLSQRKSLLETAFKERFGVAPTSWVQAPTGASPFEFAPRPQTMGEGDRTIMAEGGRAERSGDGWLLTWDRVPGAESYTVRFFRVDGRTMPGEGIPPPRDTKEVRLAVGGADLPAGTLNWYVEAHMPSEAGGPDGE